MTRDELLARLQSIEWSDIEFKEATWAAPRDALETVSAFANTSGARQLVQRLTDAGVQLKLLREQQQSDAQRGEENGH